MSPVYFRPGSLLSGLRSNLGPGLGLGWSLLEPVLDLEVDDLLQAYSGPVPSAPSDCVYGA